MAIVTWDAVNKGTEVILSNGNLTAVIPNSNNTVRANEGRLSGKWYWEISFDSAGVNGAPMIGIVNKDALLNTNNFATQNVRYYYGTNGRKYPEASAYGDSYIVKDIVGVSLDLDSGVLSFYKNGVAQGISHTNILNMDEVFPAVTGGGSGAFTLTVNFGSSPFKYPVPQGYKAYYKPISNKSFILKELEYNNRVNGKWNSVSSTLPTLTQFQNEGIDDLSTLDRKVQLVDNSPQIMTNEGVLGEGKVFKSTVNLNKYFDLRKLEVK